MTIVRTGYIDHSDSLGATARFGMGDVQWLTAGAGVVHSEMFPLLHADRPNDLELFQIWLNLPGRDKLVAPYFTMFWDQDLPRAVHRDADGRTVTITVIAGALDGLAPLAPPPNSWAARPEVGRGHLVDRARARRVLGHAAGRWCLDHPDAASVPRHGPQGRRADREGPSAIQVHADQAVPLAAVDGAAEVLLLQGRPIGEPVAQHGPFVMNTRAELEQAFEDYRRTQFGGWPFPENAPVHPRDRGRFARHADGRVEEAGA